MTAPAFREPITPSIATTTTVAAPAPTSRVQHDPRPLPVQLHHHHHHHHHRVPHRLQHRHTSHLHTKPSPIRKPYRSTWAIPAPWSLKKQRGQRTRSKSQRDDKFSPSVARSGSPNAAHLVCDVQRRRSTHVLCGSLRRMRLRAMRQGYRLQDRRRGSAGTYGGYSTPVEAIFGCGHAATADVDAVSTATIACSQSRRWELTQVIQEDHRRGVEEFGRG